MTPTDFRVEAGLTVKACLDLLGVSETRWHEWDSGKAQMPKYIKSSMQAHIDVIRLKRIILQAAGGDCQWDRLVGGVSVYWPDLAEQMRNNNQPGE